MPTRLLRRSQAVVHTDGDEELAASYRDQRFFDTDSPETDKEEGEKPEEL